LKISIKLDRIHACILFPNFHTTKVALFSKLTAT
jgi:hypothetical protein